MGRAGLRWRGLRGPAEEVSPGLKPSDRVATTNSSPVRPFGLAGLFAFRSPLAWPPHRLTCHTFFDMLRKWTEFRFFDGFGRGTPAGTLWFSTRTISLVPLFLCRRLVLPAALQDVNARHVMHVVVFQFGGSGSAHVPL